MTASDPCASRPTCAAGSALAYHRRAPRDSPSVCCSWSCAAARPLPPAAAATLGSATGRPAARAQRLRRGVADRRLHPARRATSPPPTRREGHLQLRRQQRPGDAATAGRAGRRARHRRHDQHGHGRRPRRRSPPAFAGNKLVIAVAPGQPRAHHRARRPRRARTSRSCWRRRRCPPASTPRRSSARPASTVKPVSLEVTVKGVVTKVSLGEADAGIVYVTDVDGGAGQDRRGRDPRRPERDRRPTPSRCSPRASTPTTPRPSSTSSSPPRARRSSPTTGSCRRREETPAARGRAASAGGRRRRRRRRTPRGRARQRAGGELAVVAGDAIAPPDAPSRRRGGRPPRTAGAPRVPAATGAASASCRSRSSRSRSSPCRWSPSSCAPRGAACPAT